MKNRGKVTIEFPDIQGYRRLKYTHSLRLVYNETTRSLERVVVRLLDGRTRTLDLDFRIRILTIFNIGFSDFKDKDG